MPRRPSPDHHHHDGCGIVHGEPRTRREALKTMGAGFGMMAFAQMVGASMREAASPIRSAMGRLIPKPDFAPRAKNVIFLFMEGGVSQVDSFDYKPMLEKHHGQDPRKAIGKLEKTQFDNIGTTFKSPWAFKRYGQCGLTVSDIFPHIGEMADELCVVRSMTSEFSVHNSANFFLHTGFGVQGRPSMGAWLNYGLGSPSDNLPGYIVMISKGRGGSQALYSRLWGSGFLPSKHQGVKFRSSGEPVLFLNNPPGINRNSRRAILDSIKAVSKGQPKLCWSP